MRRHACAHQKSISICWWIYSRSLSHIYSWSVRHFKSFWSSFITKGHPVNKHCCLSMNRRLWWGPVRRTDWMDRILIDTFGSSSPAAVIQDGLCRSWRGGSRRRKEEQRWVRIVKKTHTGLHKHTCRECTEVREIENGTMTSCQRYRSLFPTINPLIQSPVIQSAISNSLFRS